MNQKEKNSFIKRVSVSEEGKLIYFLKQWIPNREDAKDIVQDVFYNLILGFEEIKDLDKITSWLYSTARFKAIDFIRKKKPTNASDLTRKEDDDNEEEDIIKLNEFKNSFTNIKKDTVAKKLAPSKFQNLCNLYTRYSHRL